MCFLRIHAFPYKNGVFFPRRGVTTQAKMGAGYVQTLKAGFSTFPKSVKFSLLRIRVRKSGLRIPNLSLTRFAQFPGGALIWSGLRHVLGFRQTCQLATFKLCEKNSDPDIPKKILISQNFLTNPILSGKSFSENREIGEIFFGKRGNWENPFPTIGKSRNLIPEKREIGKLIGKIMGYFQQIGNFFQMREIASFSKFA